MASVMVAAAEEEEPGEGSIDILRWLSTTPLSDGGLLITVPWEQWVEIARRLSEYGIVDRTGVKVVWRRVERRKRELCVEIGDHITFSLIFPLKIYQQIRHTTRFYVSPLATPPLTDWFFIIEPA